MAKRYRIALTAALALMVLGAVWLLRSQPGTSPVPRAARITPAARFAISDVSAQPSAASDPVPDAGRKPTEKLAKDFVRPQALGSDPPASLSRVAVTGTSASALRARSRELGIRVVRSLPQLDVVVVESASSGRSADELAAKLRLAGISSTPAQPVYPAIRPNDTYFANQWGFENTGQSGGTAGADSKAYAAWDWARGDGVVVAVTDTGVDFSAADLAGKAWTNPGEIAGNGLDDDGNGYVDDVNGYDLLNGDGTVFDLGNGDQHGTHVAGTIAASTNNGAGVAGMGWNAKVMSLKFLGQHEGSDIDGAAAIVYAVDNGADVINASWGGTVYSPILENAVSYAAAHDVLVVCAAGNNGANSDTTPFYPASLPETNVVSVAALDRTNALASFSNRGASSVDLGAPGVAVLSTVPRWAAGLLIDDAPFKAVYLPFQAESIANATTRNQVISKAMAELATSTANPVLLVDDSWGSLTTAYEPADRRRNIYLSSLSAAGYNNVSVWSTSASGTPSAADMSGKTVVWFTGASTFAIPSVWPLIETHGTLTTAERTQVGAFLDGGGRLFISSGDLAYEMSYLAATKGTLTWFRNYLHARFLADDPGLYTVLGRSSTIYAGMSWTIDDWLRYSDGCDDVGPYDGQATALALWPHDYVYMDGTSMASPHVAGTVALMKSRMPSLTGAQLKQRLLATADPVASLAGLSVSGGRLDTAEAVGVLEAPSGLRAWPSAADSIRIAWTNPTTPDFAYTRVLSRVGTDPVGPSDPAATVVYEGVATSAAASGLTAGDQLHVAAFARSNLGGWSAAALTSATVPAAGSGVPIPVGTNVEVTTQGVTLTFPSVTEPGWLSITRIPPAKQPPAATRWIADGYYEIHPVGSFTYPVDIDLPYQPTAISGRESKLRLYHDTGTWQDVTVSVDTAANVVHARTSSFSEFGLGEPVGVNVEASAELPYWSWLLLALLVAAAVRWKRVRV